MKTTIITAFLTVTFLTAACSTIVCGQTRSIGVSINGATLTSDVLAALEQLAGARIPDGRYWYDAHCGAWGREGGPTLGFGQAGINFGLPMKANASNGRSGTFINGRELPTQDVASLNALIAPSRVLPGRFWLDPYGNVGYEGGPALGNLVQVAQAKYGNRAGGGRSKYAGIGSVIGDGSGAIGYLDHDVGVTIR